VWSYERVDAHLGSVKSGGLLASCAIVSFSKISLLDGFGWFYDEFWAVSCDLCSNVED
jgi:hypothetical protein